MNQVPAGASTPCQNLAALHAVSEKLPSQGAEPFISTRQQFAMLIKADIAKYAHVIKTANIRLEN